MTYLAFTCLSTMANILFLKAKQKILLVKIKKILLRQYDIFMYFMSSSSLWFWIHFRIDTFLLSVPLNFWISTFPRLPMYINSKVAVVMLSCVQLYWITQVRVFLKQQIVLSSVLYFVQTTNAITHYPWTSRQQIMRSALLCPLICLK